MSGDVEKSDFARSKERRRSPREKGLRSGRITYSRDGASMVCVVLDLSSHGARLTPADMHQCPSRFSLRLAGKPARECEVVWREKAQMGVKFV